MPTPSPRPEPEILRPRMGSGSTLFSDSNLDMLSHLLDDFLRIPGTNIRFGLDGIVGLIPGIGDILGAMASWIIILAAWLRGVPKVTLARMLANVAIETIIGTVPVLGDAFDIAWKANRRNLPCCSVPPATATVPEPHPGSAAVSAGHDTAAQTHAASDWLFLRGCSGHAAAARHTAALLAWIAGKFLSPRHAPLGDTIEVGA